MLPYYVIANHFSVPGFILRESMPQLKWPAGKKTTKVPVSPGLL